MYNAGMKELVWIVVAILAQYSTIVKAQGQGETSTDRTGLQLQEECQFAVSNSAQGRSLTPEQAVKKTHCLGYLLGVMDTLGEWRAMNDLLHAPSDLRPYACVPNGTTVEEIVQVILKHLNDHPNELHRYESYVVTQALTGAYPCMP